MAKKRVSDTLRQRKFAQEEFLKLKKMQSGELDAGPKPSETVTPLSFRDKIANIWYHDKFAIMIIGIIIAAIALLCVQCATKTEYDATIVIFTHDQTGDNNCAKMAEYIKPYCEDINGDGEINVRYINSSFDESQGNTEFNYTTRASTSTLLAEDETALLFITDEGSYEELMGMSKKVKLFEGEPLKFDDDFYEFCVDESGFFDTPEELQISCRTIKGTAIADNDGVDKHYDQAQRILSSLSRKIGKRESLKTVEEIQ